MNIFPKITKCRKYLFKLHKTFQRLNISLNSFQTSRQHQCNFSKLYSHTFSTCSHMLFLTIIKNCIFTIIVNINLNLITPISHNHIKCTQSHQLHTITTISPNHNNLIKHTGVRDTSLPLPYVLYLYNFSTHLLTSIKGFYH